MGMKAIRCRGGAGAFTLLELLSVIAVIIVLAALLLSALENVRAQAKRAQCVSRLKQIGIGFQNFAHDHNGLFPMALPANAGGTLEFAASGRRLAGDFYFSFRHLQALSNELVTPQLLTCPADTRLPGPNFGLLQNSNVSYFVGINASYASPDSILAGDRNVTNDWAGAPSLVRLGAITRCVGRTSCIVSKATCYSQTAGWNKKTRLRWRQPQARPRLLPSWPCPPSNPLLGILP